MIKGFKQLVAAIAGIESEEDRNYVCGEINLSFEHEKISWKDHEMLYQLACRLA